MISQSDVRILTVMIEKTDRLIEVCNKHSDIEIENDYTLSDTIELEFQKLYEDSLRLSTELIIYHPELHIDDLRGIRNRVAHNYESVSLKILIDTARNDIPVLREILLNFIMDNQ